MSRYGSLAQFDVHQLPFSWSLLRLLLQVCISLMVCCARDSGIVCWFLMCFAFWCCAVAADCLIDILMFARCRGASALNRHRLAVACLLAAVVTGVIVHARFGETTLSVAICTRDGICTALTPASFVAMDLGSMTLALLQAGLISANMGISVCITFGVRALALFR